MSFDFEFDNEKDLLIKKTRGVGFEEIIAAIIEDRVLDIKPHHNQKNYPQQIIYQVDIDGYVWLVPAIKSGRNVRLITAYPSGRATRKRKKGQRNEKEN